MSPLQGARGQFVPIRVLLQSKLDDGSSTGEPSSVYGIVPGVVDFVAVKSL
jgi:hypothetical protein